MLGVGSGLTPGISGLVGAIGVVLVLTEAGELVGVGVTTGAGEMAVDTVGRLRLHPLSMMTPTPINNLKYFTLN
jgi:hypothetical protein